MLIRPATTCPEHRSVDGPPPPDLWLSIGGGPSTDSPAERLRKERKRATSVLDKKDPIQATVVNVAEKSEQDSGRYD
jgi:hypothetical protein